MLEHYGDTEVRAVQQVKVASNLIEDSDGLHRIWCINYRFSGLSLTHIFVGHLFLASSEQHQAMGQLWIRIYMHLTSSTLPWPSWFMNRFSKHAQHIKYLGSKKYFICLL